MSIESIIEHLEKNENIPSYDKSYYIDELKKLQEDECPAGECCPHCNARQERGDDGKCNRCGKEWAIKEDIFSLVESKIADQTVTVEDFDRLIGEAFKPSITDRVQRRIRKSEEAGHIDNKTGHQKLKEPSMPGRITPKVDKQHSQMHHRGKSGHARSTATQRRNAKQS